jgi:hypothetical protein
MSETPQTYIDLCLSGKALADDIHDSVSQWHEGTDTRPLHAYLGFTEDEYAVWVERPQAHKFILYARKKSLSFQEPLELRNPTARAAPRRQVDRQLTKRPSCLIGSRKEHVSRPVADERRQSIVVLALAFVSCQLHPPLPRRR